MPEERGLYPKQPVLDQLVYLGRLRGLSASAAQASVTTHLERLGLAERAKDHVEKLSLGNQQRVQIIAALMGRPRALVLDEPFSGLDPRRRRQHGRPVARAHRARRAGPLLLPPARPRRAALRAPRRARQGPGRRVGHARTSCARPRSRGTGSSCPATPGGCAASRACTPSTSRDTRALLEVVEHGAERRLLEEALRRGEVHEFSPQRPSLAQIYREVTA